MRTAFAFIALALLLLMEPAYATAADCDAPKADFQITSPPASVTPAVAAFSGIWVGNWTFSMQIGTSRVNVVRCNRLYVAVRDNQSARVADCVGATYPFNFPPRCDLYDAKIIGGELRFETIIYSARSYKLAGRGTLAAQSKNRTNQTILTELHKQ
jgi:hypothetical protein